MIRRRAKPKEKSAAKGRNHGNQVGEFVVENRSPMKKATRPPWGYTMVALRRELS